MKNKEIISLNTEELNRKMISQLADIHICPTEISVKNLYIRL